MKLASYNKDSAHPKFKKKKKKIFLREYNIGYNANDLVDIVISKRSVTRNNKCYMISFT